MVLNNEELAEYICDRLCRHCYELSQEALDEHCKACPVNLLTEPKKTVEIPNEATRVQAAVILRKALKEIHIKAPDARRYPAQSDKYWEGQYWNEEGQE